MNFKVHCDKPFELCYIKASGKHPSHVPGLHLDISSLEMRLLSRDLSLCHSLAVSVFIELAHSVSSMVSPRMLLRDLRHNIFTIVLENLPQKQ